MSDLTYRELGTSTDLAKRMEYVKRIKQDIALGEIVLARTFNPELHDQLKRTQEEMKERLATYDVYQQKMVYRCPRCNEENCVCINTREGL